MYLLSSTWCRHLTAGVLLVMAGMLAGTVVFAATPAAGLAVALNASSGSGDVASALQDAQEAIDLTEQNLDLIVKTFDSMGAFNDGHVVHGPEGEELQQDLRDYLGNATRVLETARGAWARSTPPASRTCRKS